MDIKNFCDKQLCENIRNMQNQCNKIKFFNKSSRVKFRFNPKKSNSSNGRYPDMTKIDFEYKLNH